MVRPQAPLGSDGSQESGKLQCKLLGQVVELGTQKGGDPVPVNQAATANTNSHLVQ